MRVTISSSSNNLIINTGSGVLDNTELDALNPAALLTGSAKPLTLRRYPSTFKLETKDTSTCQPKTLFFTEPSSQAKGIALPWMKNHLTLVFRHAKKTCGSLRRELRQGGWSDTAHDYLIACHRHALKNTIHDCPLHLVALALRNILHLQLSVVGAVILALGIQEPLPVPGLIGLGPARACNIKGFGVRRLGVRGLGVQGLPWSSA